MVGNMAAETPPPFFTDGQQRVIASSLTLLAIGATVAAVIWAIVLLARFVGFFSSVLWPLVVAGVLALILRPLIASIEKRLRLQRSAAVVLLYGVFVLLAAAVLFLILPPLIDQSLTFVEYAPSLWTSGKDYLTQHYPQWVAFAERQLGNPTIHQLATTVSGEIKEMLSHSMPTLGAAGGSVVGLFAFLTHLAIIPVYLFFFLLARGDPTKKMQPNLTFLSPGVRADVVFLTREFIGIVETFFRGQLLIGLIMGVMLAIGFTLIGLKFGLIIGLVIGLLNIVPYLGTIVGLAVTLPLAFLQPDGGWRLVGLVLLVKLIVQAVEGWVLTPRIMGARTGLHPVAIIVAIFFWGTAFQGILGMLVAIPITAFFVTVWRLAKRKYFHAPA
jgi:predicted PurR-regulated permease PerM